MNEHLNPDYPKQRGCFIDENKDKNDKNFGKFKVVDYPTWTARKGRLYNPQNPPIPETEPSESNWFDTKSEAFSFCKDENYVVCAYPKSDEELAELRAKREAYWAKHGGDEAERDAFDEALDI